MGDASLLIVDDHPLFAEGFVHMARNLRPDWMLQTASSAAQARCVLDAVMPDIAIVDVGLPDDDGFGLLAQMKQKSPGLPVVLISGRDDEAVRVRARVAGAAGFITKTTMPDSIVDRIDIVLQGGTTFDDRAVAGALPELTLRQAEVLALLAEGHANKEIRYRMGIAERTVRAHLTELFHALGANSRMQAVIRGRELGLIGR